MNLIELATNIKTWGKELGFDQVGITDVDLKAHESYLQNWLDNGYHGEMDWMARHGMMRARPEELLPGTLRVLSARMDYLPPEAQFASNLKDTHSGYISRYALGRDYHKLVRNQLKKLAQKIEQEVEALGYRPFVDSAPILERPLAEKAGLGWVGKHSLLLNKEAGSWFFLGELLIDLPLPIDVPKDENECGHCVACITSCPTQAIVDNKVVDSRRCISYLTIEYDGIIPLEFRKAIGNRIYGCDDCQLVCPWNREAEITQHTDFHRRNEFDDAHLLKLFSWSEAEFLERMQGSAIRRIGHTQWLRNIAIAIGNAPYSEDYIPALTERLGIDEGLDEHLLWAIAEQKAALNNVPNVDRKKQRLIRIVEKGLSRDA
ncbi:tRNA epoxyqueuosine(34) reductase QueG [Vibrio agarivorans]|uniref:tRNA epoxyqueuosine(34) reductase QueG n=1 Tax=Vibrio agarivorans TaxID=153622 RepID=UPI0025B56893|nr:tRNA epoxyqueuosine(34) reductase QueG [Vibrio agarivorans]MDN3662295.1 tRNA epoxyqueuosine(34) reductase QueG [Vibrio agarivorans]